MSDSFTGQQINASIIRLTAAQWSAQSYVLPVGVIGIESDTGAYKIGDGATAWASLLAYSAPTGVKVYRALLTQTGTNAPVATVLENTLGGTVVWTYSDVGTYAGTLAGAFTVDKTFCDGDTSWFNSSDLTGARVAYFAPSGTGNSVLLSTGIAAETLSDGLLANYAVEIIVYP